MAAKKARVHSMLGAVSVGSGHCERMRKSYCAARWAKAVAEGWMRLATPCMCWRPTPVAGEGICSTKRIMVWIASSVRWRRNPDFQ